jgi:cell division protein FtsB
MRGVKTKEDGKWKKVAVFIILLLVLGVLLNSVNNIYQKKKVAQETLARMQKEAADLQNRSAELKDSITKLNTKEGLDFEIRQKLNVAQAGESVAVIVDQKQTATTTSVKISTWQKINNFFTSLFR